jgi:hypothetical protein
MKVNIDIKLIKELLDGVIFIDRAGHVLDFNSAARPYLNSCFDSEEKLAHAIEKCIANETDGPVAIFFAGTDPGLQNSVDVHLCMNENNGAVIFITRRNKGDFPTTFASTTTNTVDLLGDAMRHQMTHILERLGRINLQRTDQEFTPLTGDIERLSRYLVAMDQLSMLYRGDSFQREEKIQLLDMINAVLVALPEQRCDYAINRILSDPKERMGTLYGNPDLLKSGLRSLFESMGDSSPPRCQVELRLRQSGNYLVLTGGFVLPRSPSLSKVQKTNQGKEPRYVAESQTDLRLSIARRIFEMHGGKLKISETSGVGEDRGDGNIESFTLTLPTGVPYLGKRMSDCEDCPATRQAEVYARDIIRLMPDNHRASELTQQEFAFLQSVMSTTQNTPNLNLPISKKSL